jgi:hypothetical protein
MPQIDLEKVNHFILRKQHLTEDTRGDSVLDVTGDIGRLHSTSTETPYLTLYARIDGFRREHLDEELYNRRRLGRIPCMRKNLYTLTEDMISVAHATTGREIQEYMRKYHEFRGVIPSDYDKLSASILDLLKDSEMNAREIKKALETLLDVSSVLLRMCAQ